MDQAKYFRMRMTRIDLDEPMGGYPKPKAVDPAPAPATVAAMVAELPTEMAPRARKGWPKGKPRRALGHAN